jgi:hypothetical protein
MKRQTIRALALSAAGVAAFLPTLLDAQVAPRRVVPGISTGSTGTVTVRQFPLPGQPGYNPNMRYWLDARMADPAIARAQNVTVRQFPLPGDPNYNPNMRYWLDARAPRINGGQTGNVTVRQFPVPGDPNYDPNMRYWLPAAGTTTITSTATTGTIRVRDVRTGRVTQVAVPANTSRGITSRAARANANTNVNANAVAAANAAAIRAQQLAGNGNFDQVIVPTFANPSLNVGGVNWNNGAAGFNIGGANFTGVATANNLTAAGLVNAGTVSAFPGVNPFFRATVANRFAPTGPIFGPRIGGSVLLNGFNNF